MTGGNGFPLLCKRKARFSGHAGYLLILFSVVPEKVCVTFWFKSRIQIDYRTRSIEYRQILLDLDQNLVDIESRSRIDSIDYRIESQSLQSMTLTNLSRSKKKVIDLESRARALAISLLVYLNITTRSLLVLVINTRSNY